MTYPIALKFVHDDEADVTHLTKSRGYRDLHPITQLDIVQDCIKRLVRMEEALLYDVYDELKGINGGHDGSTESAVDSTL